MDEDSKPQNPGSSTRSSKRCRILMFNKEMQKHYLLGKSRLDPATGRHEIMVADTWEDVYFASRSFGLEIRFPPGLHKPNIMHVFKGKKKGRRKDRKANYHRRAAGKAGKGPYKNSRRHLPPCAVQTELAPPGESLLP